MRWAPMDEDLAALLQPADAAIANSKTLIEENQERTARAQHWVARLQWLGQEFSPFYHLKSKL